MIRGTSLVLALGLFALWISGLTIPDSPEGITWLEGLLCVIGFTATGYYGSVSSPGVRFLFVYSAMILALFLGGLIAGDRSFLTWWNLVLGVYGLVMALIGRGSLRTQHRDVTRHAA